MQAHRFTLMDDDPDGLFLLHSMLARLYPGSSISMFSTAEDALAHILDTGTDLLITNHGMGEMTGTELIRELRIRKWAIPIIAISGSSAAEKDAMAAGATRYVAKSEPRRILEAHVRALIDVLDTKVFKQQQAEHHPTLRPPAPRPARKATAR